MTISRKIDMGVYPPGMSPDLRSRLASIIEYFDAGYEGFNREYAATLREIEALLYVRATPQQRTGQ